MKEAILVGEHKFEADFSYFGFEKYYLDGELIHKRWNFRPAGTREFKIDNRLLRIEVCVRPSEYFCKVYLDNELYIEELFPDFRAKIDEQRKRAESPASTWKRLLLVIIWAAVFLSIFSQLQAKP